MSLYDIDYKAFVKQLLPGTMRKMVMWRWLLVLIAPVIYVYNLFKSNRASNLYYLQYTSQVVYMQAVVNDTFDDAERRITITDDPNKADPIYILLDAEQEPTWLPTEAETQPVYMLLQYQQLLLPYIAFPMVWVWTDDEIASYYDFVVNVPAAVAFDEAYMKALINQYRLPGKSNYQILIT